MDQLPLTQVERKRQLALAAKALLSDYATDHELTSFTALDSEVCYIPDELQWENPPFRRRRR